MEWALAGSSSAEIPPDMLVGLIMARTGRLPDEIERQDHFKLVRAWQILQAVDRVRARQE